MKRTAVLFPVLLLAACAGGGLMDMGAPQAPPTSSGMVDRYAAILAESASLHRTIMVDAGRAHSAGLLTDEQLETVRAAGKIAEGALRAAKASLLAYLESGSATIGAELGTRFLAAQDEILALLRLLRSLGGTP